MFAAFGFPTNLDKRKKNSLGIYYEFEKFSLFLLNLCPILFGKMSKNSSIYDPACFFIYLF